MIHIGIANMWSFSGNNLNQSPHPIFTWTLTSTIFGGTSGTSQILLPRYSYNFRTRYVEWMIGKV